MTPEYLLQKFIEHGEKMRIAQKGYFKLPYNMPGKKEALAESKRAEKEFDELLVTAKKIIQNNNG